MTLGDTTSGTDPDERSANRMVIDGLLEKRHARKDMLNGLFRDYFRTPATIRCVLDEHVLHLSPLDSTITPAVLEKGHWNRHELDRALDVLRGHGALREGGLFLDVGANIGTQSIYALLSGVFDAVHAFEPEPENARLLAMNLDENDLGERARVFRQAVGRSEGQATLHRHPRNAGAHSLVSSKSGVEDGEITVPVTSLDQHLTYTGTQPNDVGLIWIDVEGAEPGVVFGAESMVRSDVPLVFEFLDRDRGSVEFAEMFQQLQRAYSHMCCLQDAEKRVSATSTLTPDLPEGDYLVFSIND